MSVSRRSVGLGGVLLILAACAREQRVASGAGGETRGGVVIGGVASSAHCPAHEPVRIRLDQGDEASFDTLPLVGGNTQIPEFHDCQRFIDSTGTAYGPLVGIFAVSSILGFNPTPATPSPDIDSRDSPEISDPAAGETPVTPPRHADGYPVAVVVDFDVVGYAPLGIRPGVNCLYVFPSSAGPHGFGARMVPVGTRADACAAAYDPSMPGEDLLVFGRRMRGDHANDYPPVARWDWDPTTRIQYAGIRCGQRWCEIGPRAGFVRSPTHDFGIPNRKERRVFAVKGWHDEQWLARPGTNGLFPQPFLGTVVPVKDLANYDSVTFATPKWIDVARVSITPFDPVYESKFHLTTSSMPNEMNQIALCQGTFQQCLAADGAPTRPPAACPTASTATWWARITNTKKEKRYHCVTRVPHVGASMPGTARWLWDDADELIWVECDEGCCRVQQGDV
jgi:hypothetical protein